MKKRKWTAAEVQKWREENRRLMYFNKEDSNIFVPKAVGIGFTFNWANPWAYVGLVVVIAVVAGIGIGLRLWLKK
ncbi:MAG: DUF5808 domain-containing protein [Oscillospiraceae bacterium]|nr:DUF5808 domain-containing protein [Oscillospiraceae bacterium]